jgi:CubicO group peptidase (beta-lactamase class C family)
MTYEPNGLQRNGSAVMTIQNLSDRSELAEARRARQSRQARRSAAPTAASTAAGALASTAADEGRWLTAILRPAGTLDRAALRGLSESLGHLASSSNMVIVDLTAAVVSSPRTFARDLLAPARTFEETGQCLLLLGASPALTAELDRHAVPVITLAADAPPPEAA